MLEPPQPLWNPGGRVSRSEPWLDIPSQRPGGRSAGCSNGTACLKGWGKERILGAGGLDWRPFVTHVKTGRGLGLQQVTSENFSYW